MKTLRCIILEDEPIAAAILRDYISAVPYLSLAAEFPNPLKAMAWLETNSADVVFLDLNMPRLKGFEFLKVSDHGLQVIITTAYHEFALESYEYQVVDYLLKPIEFSRFVQAAEKLGRESKGTRSEKAPPQALFFNVNRAMVRVTATEILWAEGVKDYVHIHTKNKNLLTRMSMADLESLLRPYDILRVHKSFLANVRQMDAYTASSVVIGKKEIPVGRQYKHVLEGLGDI